VALIVLALAISRRRLKYIMPQSLAKTNNANYNAVDVIGGRVRVRMPFFGYLLLQQALAGGRVSGGAPGGQRMQGVGAQGQHARRVI
jgi:hypothetical protein